MSDNVIIRAKDLKKHFRGGAIKALDGVSTDIRQGEVVVVIGPSGSGKSTLLRSLNMLEVPTDGSIFFHGEDDDFVPCEMSLRNYEACIAPKTLCMIPGAGHCLGCLVDTKTYLDTLNQFYDSLPDLRI